MRYLAATLAIIFLMLGGSVARADTATPTPTPTLTPLPTLTPTGTLIPIQPTATSRWEYFRATPSPMVLPTLAPHSTLAIKDGAGSLADSVVNHYKAINSTHVADIGAFILVAMIVVAMLLRIQNKITR